MNTIKTVSDKVFFMRKHAQDLENMGENLLAKWFADSATHHEKVLRDTTRFLDRMNHDVIDMRTSYQLDHDDFVKQWFNYESENLCNWDRG